MVAAAEALLGRGAGGAQQGAVRAAPLLCYLTLCGCARRGAHSVFCFHAECCAKRDLCVSCQRLFQPKLSFTRAASLAVSCSCALFKAMIHIA